ncbi:MAG: ABC transporter permease [Candidatus Odinarchaeota archaeon]
MERPESNFEGGATVNKKRFQQFENVISNAYLRFVVVRGIFYLIAIFFALSFVFLLPRLVEFVTGTDPIRRRLAGIATNPQTQDLADEIIAAQRAYFGLDRPIWEQFILFWQNMLRFDLGKSMIPPNKLVVDMVLPLIILTMMLVIPVWILAFFIGNWIGARAAFHKGPVNNVIYFLSLLVNSAPFYWFGLVFLDVVVFGLGPSLKLGNFQIFNYPGRMVVVEWTAEYWTTPQLVLPLISYFLPPFFVLLIWRMGGWATGMRAMTLYEMESGYMLYAEQLGFKPKKLRQYAQRNAILPQITGLNLSLGELIGASLVTEHVFLWPGIGSRIFRAFADLDYPFIMGLFIVIIFVMVVGNYIVDISYGFIDPRIRTGYRT